MPKLILDQTVIVHLKLMMKGWALLSNTLFSAIVCSTFVEMMRMVVVMVTAGKQYQRQKDKTIF